MNDEQQHRRIYWQCRRGMLELDELLQRYFDAYFSGLSAQEKDSFAQLLSMPDQELSELLLRGGRCADATLNNVIDQIRSAQ